MTKYTCLEKCCTIDISPYYSIRKQYDYSQRKREKAGVFIYDPNQSKCLLIQSRGHLWGPPKGTLNDNENVKDCALRELMEETGIKLEKERLDRSVKIRNRATYFYIEMDICGVNVQDHIPGNDANGIMWIKPICLLQLIKIGKIKLNQHCRILFQKFLDIDYPLTT